LLREVESEVGCSAAVIRAMVKAGIVHQFRQRSEGRARWSLGGSDVRHPLTDEQQAAVTVIRTSLTANKFAPILLDGITGSGKTEVYLRALESTLELGRCGIVLVPEIGLTPATSGAVERRFGDRVAVMHSAQSEGDRWHEWERVRTGDARIVIGPRSALFAPLTDLGLIVVDEEHDAAYKQQESPRYHARDLALVLGQRLGVPVLMCSATPSVEASALVHRGLAERLVLSRRVGGGALPTVELVDLRAEPPDPGEQGRTLFSGRLREAIGETLGAGNQIILLMQRRGWAPLVQCRECGHRIECPECSVSLVVHRRSRDLRCHYCGHRAPHPRTCPSCGGELMDPIGAGTEKVADHLQRLFPDIPAAILDRDTVRRRGGLEATLGAFAAGKVRILVGTQMVAKGHHFPAVTLTGVISADALLGLPDFRAGERTFQLLTQVAGRAGRGIHPGHVIVQTYHPDHPAVRHATRHDTTSFLEEELVFRQAFAYPPAARMALIRFEGTAQAAVRRAAENGARALPKVPDRARLRGPAPAPIERIRGAWRWQILLSATSREILRHMVVAIESGEVPSGVRRVVDVDPLSTL
jgi:primosomal protein N' (replication factor Y)